MLRGMSFSHKILDDRLGEGWDRIFLGLDMNPHSPIFCRAGRDRSYTGDHDPTQKILQIFFL